MRRLGTILLVWLVATGAFYEWGGDAAKGVRELKKGNHREALESLRKGRAELPRSAAVRYDEGLAYGGLGLTDSALAAYRDAAGSPWLEGDAARSAAAFNLGNEAMRAEKRMVAANSVLAAVAITSLKIFVGVTTGSLGILSEAAHSGTPQPHAGRRTGLRRPRSRSRFSWARTRTDRGSGCAAIFARRFSRCRIVRG